MRILDLNTDVLLKIVDHIDAPATLLALGLTCRTFATLTIPFPIQYRRISWPTDNSHAQLGLAYANWISQVPRRGKAVRDIRVGGHRTCRVPAFLRDECCSVAKVQEAAHADTDTVTTTSLVQALQHTPYLTTVVYDWTPPPPTSAFWSSLLQLRELQTVSFRIDGHRDSTSSNTLTALLPTLRATSPSLQSITLGLSLNSSSAHQSFDLSPLLALHFPSLHTLSISSARAPPLALATFLSFHPTILSLRLRGPGFDLSVVPPAVLPRLTSLDVSTAPFIPTTCHRPTAYEFGQPFLRPLPGGGFRPIRNLKLSALDRDQVVEFSKLLPYLPYLKVLRPAPSPRKAGGRVHPGLWSDWRFLKWSAKAGKTNGEERVSKIEVKKRLLARLHLRFDKVHKLVGV